jgi:hypothetical protein
MPIYLTRTTFPPDRWTRQLATAEATRTAALDTLEAIGGTLHGFWYDVCAHDGYTLWEGPADVSATDVGRVLSCGETRHGVETTTLLTVDEIKDLCHRRGAGREHGRE